MTVKSLRLRSVPQPCEIARSKAEVKMQRGCSGRRTDCKLLRIRRVMAVDDEGEVGWRKASNVVVVVVLLEVVVLAEKGLRLGG